MERTPCRARVLTAIQQSETVLVVAEGEHATSGYRVVLEQSSLAVFPPEFELTHVPPTGRVLEVRTPFLAWASFPATVRVEHVAVHDAGGRHRVPVATPDGARAASCTVAGPPGV